MIPIEAIDDLISRKAISISEDTARLYGKYVEFPSRQKENPRKGS